MTKRKIGEVLWLALRYAVEDRITLADAYSNDKTETAVIDAEADIRAFRALQIKLFGTDKSKLDVMLSNMQPRNILKMLAEDIDDAEQKMHPTLRESAASDSESSPAPKRVI